MTDHENDLIHGHLDGLLTGEQEAALNRWITASSANARAFAEHAILHDRLGDMLRSRAAPSGHRPATCKEPPALPPRPWLSRRRVVTACGSLAGLAAAFLLAFWLWPARAASAQSELQRLINTALPSIDRIYRIASRGPSATETDSRQPPIDGATLYIRSPDKYVLERHFPDGRSFVTGFDGARSWAVPPDGTVRVSTNPERFSGPVPGHQHGIPFVDIRSDLVQIRDAYIVTLQPPQPNGWHVLLAEKKSPEYRGPRRVQLEYDAQSGLIHRMIFDGLPRAHGGPDGVAVELLEQRNLDTTFFEHESHHTPDRKVVEEAF